MSPFQAPRPSLRLTALLAVPCLGLTMVAPATALGLQSLGATSPGSTHSAGAAAVKSASPADATTAAHYVRPFKATSWWNTPLGAAPIDSHSRSYIKDSQNKAHTQDYLKLVLGDWGLPSYRSDSADPKYQLNETNGQTVSVHIPKHARQQPTSDGALSVVDSATNQAVGLSGAKYVAGRWTATGVSRYYLGSHGITQGLANGTKGNLGHRGIPSPMQSVSKREVRRGAINHRLEVYWWETAATTPQGPDAYFPMSNSESGKNGVVPEGIVVRIKRSVDLKARHMSPAARVVARALQKYGAVVGDNSGSGNNLKLQSNANWTGMLNQDSLSSIHWRDYVFVKGGYRP